MTPQEKPLDRLLREAGTPRRGVVVVGPLLSYEWRSFVSRIPSTRFILIGEIAADDLPRNATVLRFDRVPSFHDAGRRSAEAARAAGGRVGIIVSASSELDDAETSAFTQGVNDVAGGDPPPLRTLPAAPDKAAVQAAIQDLRAQGIDVFLVGLGSLDPWALEVLKTSGGKAVLAGWRASGAFGSQVLLAVEQDVPGGIARALSASSRGQASVEGPVILVTGGSGDLAAASSTASSGAPAASPAASAGK
jgi:hypothetical protein